MMNELEHILRVSINSKATDVHITKDLPARIRVDNKLVPISTSSIFDPNVIVEQIMQFFPEEQQSYFKEKFRNLNDVDCAFTAMDKTRVRANIYRSANGVSIAMRILPLRRLTADEIGLSAAVRNICNNKSGLFLVTGANGSGKSSTIAAMIDIINATKNAHILTIEDPIENIIESKMSLVSQREVHIHTPGFYTALRSSLRENPDVIMLGEMRDTETTKVAIELAETGHLVLATMHTRSAISTIDRLISMFAGEEQDLIRKVISENILGVQSQTLLAKKSGGLVAAFEVLLSNNALKNLIREGKTSQIYSMLQTNQSMGMCAMEETLFNLIKANIVTKEEAISKLQDPRNLISMLQNAAMMF